MSRTVEQIQSNIEAYVKADPILSAELTSTSRRAHWLLWTFVVATAQSIHEQFIDIVLSEIEEMVDRAPAGSYSWVQDKIFDFQYDSANPQVLQLDTETMGYRYPVVDDDLKIITRCSVSKGIYNKVVIKTAKSEPPTALTPLELAAVQSYINTIGVAGVVYEVQSTAADKLFIEADIYYNGLYSAVIQANVISAIDSYLAGIDFNGKIVTTDLEVAIRSVTGVTDVVIKNLGARKDSTAFADKTMLISNSTEQLRNWQMVSGYAVGETTAGETFADRLTFKTS